MIWELKIRKTNKRHSQKFFSWEHARRGGSKEHLREGLDLFF